MDEWFGSLLALFFTEPTIHCQKTLLVIQLLMSQSSKEELYIQCITLTNDSLKKDHGKQKLQGEDIVELLPGPLQVPGEGEKDRDTADHHAGA